MNSIPPPPGSDWSARKPGPDGDGTPAPKKKRYWWRFSLASLIIVAVTAAATSSAILLYINSIAEAFGTGANKELSHEVEEVITDVHGGEPETILILGATSAIAQAYARRRASGASFVLVGRREDRLAAIAADLIATGANSAETVVVDLAELE